VLFPTLYWLLVARETFTSDQFEQYSNFGETNHPAATAQDCKRSPSVKNQFLPPVWLANVLRLPKIPDGLVYPMCLVMPGYFPFKEHYPNNYSSQHFSCKYFLHFFGGSLWRLFMLSQIWLKGNVAGTDCIYW
jgi:hypothetical protein